MPNNKNRQRVWKWKLFFISAIKALSRHFFPWGVKKCNKALYFVCQEKYYSFFGNSWSFIFSTRDFIQEHFFCGISLLTNLENFLWKLKEEKLCEIEKKFFKSYFNEMSRNSVFRPIIACKDKMFFIETLNSFYIFVQCWWIYIYENVVWLFLLVLDEANNFSSVKFRWWEKLWEYFYYFNLMI